MLLGIPDVLRDRGERGLDGTPVLRIILRVLPPLPIAWLVRRGERYPELRAEPDDLIALDDNEDLIGHVKYIPAGPDQGRWQWSMLMTHDGTPFSRPRNGTSPTRVEAARKLVECWRTFRAWFRLAA